MKRRFAEEDLPGSLPGHLQPYSGTIMSFFTSALPKSFPSWHSCLPGDASVREVELPRVFAFHREGSTCQRGEVTCDLLPSPCAMRGSGSAPPNQVPSISSASLSTPPSPRPAGRADDTTVAQAPARSTWAPFRSRCSEGPRKQERLRRPRCVRGAAGHGGAAAAESR